MWWNKCVAFAAAPSLCVVAVAAYPTLRCVVLSFRRLRGPTHRIQWYVDTLLRSMSRLPSLKPCVAPAQTATIVRNRTMDPTCGTSRFAVYFEDSPVAALDPVASDVCASPCVDPTDVTPCLALDNSTYAVNTIIGCYCKTALQQAMAGMFVLLCSGATLCIACRGCGSIVRVFEVIMIMCRGAAEDGLIAGAERLQETESDLCMTFAKDYLQTQGLLVGAAVTIVAINAGMRSFMRCTCAWRLERVFSAVLCPVPHHNVTSPRSCRARQV